MGCYCYVREICLRNNDLGENLLEWKLHALMLATIELIAKLLRC
jgi:hypothetical protein